MRTLAAILPPLFALVLAPLLPGLINRTKAFVAGRRGPPLLQPIGTSSNTCAAARSTAMSRPPCSGSARW